MSFKIKISIYSDQQLAIFYQLLIDIVLTNHMKHIKKYKGSVEINSF